MWPVPCLGVVTLGLLASCGTGGAGAAVRPEDPSAVEAIAGADISCKQGSYAEPLVIDLPADQRVDFESAMESGVALVRYDCRSMKMLKDCRLPGEYAFTGVSLKEHVLSLDDKDELKANLPFSGGKIGGELERGSSLQVALVYVGKRTVAAKGVARPNLEGSQCGEATHWLRAATVGAFAVKTGTKGRVAAAAEIFGAGTSGESSSEKKVSQKDGDLAACKSSSPTSKAPPQQCRAAIRFELVPITDKAAAGGKKEEGKKAKALEDPCPEGFKLSEGKCARAADAASHLCDKNDEADCRKQCAAGHAGSCHNLANLAFYDFGKDNVSEEVEKKNYQEALTHWKKACDGGVMESCGDLGYMLLVSSYGLPADPAGGQTALRRACDGGYAEGCYDLAYHTLNGKRGVTKDAVAGLALQQRGCGLGDAFACQELGEFYFKGKHVAKDVAQGDRLLSRFCDQGDLGSCADLAAHLVTWFDDDEGPPKPIPEVKDALGRAKDLYTRACSGISYSCNLAARLHNDAGDKKKALELAEKACQPNATDKKKRTRMGCGLAGVLLLEGKGGVTADRGKAVDYMIQSMDEPTMMRAAKILEKGDGVKADKGRALAVYKDLCDEYEYKPACADKTRLSR